MLPERGIRTYLVVAQWQPPGARIGIQDYGGTEGKYFRA